MDIENRLTQIKAQLAKTESKYDKEKLVERIGKLAGGVAVIKIGAPTESAQKNLNNEWKTRWPRCAHDGRRGGARGDCSLMLVSRCLARTVVM